MLEYNYKDLPTLMFGSMLNEQTLKDVITRGELPKDTLLIVMGFGRLTKRRMNVTSFTRDLSELNYTLKNINSTVLYFRGVSDDAELFNTNAIDMSNIKTLQDYTLIQTSFGKCLGIGGRISYDRSWRKKQTMELGRELWQEGEGFLFDEDKLKSILHEHSIDVFFTDVLPSFVNFYQNEATDGWFLDDETLSSDMIKEKQWLDKVYLYLTSSNESKPKKWFGTLLEHDYQTPTVQIINNISFELIHQEKLLFCHDSDNEEIMFGHSFRKRRRDVIDGERFVGAPIIEENAPQVGLLEEGEF